MWRRWQVYAGLDEDPDSILLFRDSFESFPAKASHDFISAMRAHCSTRNTSVTLIFGQTLQEKTKKTRLFILRLKIIRYFTLLCFSLKYTFKILRGWFIDYFCWGEFPSVHFINRWAKLKVQLLSYIFRQCLVCFWKLRFFSSSTVNFHSWVRWSQIQMWVYVIWTNYLTSPFSSESWDY